MKIRILEDFAIAVMELEDGTMEILRIAGEPAIKPAPVPPKPTLTPKAKVPLSVDQLTGGLLGAHGCRPDAKHPYVVLVMGVPMFASSKAYPDRVKAMLQQGASPDAVLILDTRSGVLYGVEGVS